MDETLLRTHGDTFEIGGDVSVHRLGFGAMQLTGPNIIGPPDSESRARDLLRRAVELGVDFLDTADAYGPGVSERLIGEALGDREDVVIATKGGLMRTPDGEWHRNGDPTYLWNAMLSSTDRLRTDTIDLYQLHRVEEDTPLAESVHALAEMKDEGYVDHVGVSGVSIEQLEAAREIVEIATVQNEYSVAEQSDDEVLVACERHDIGYIPFFPLAGGDLQAAPDALEAIAAAHDATPAQIALAWLLERSPVTLPIPGTGSGRHLEENVAAAGIDLSRSEYERLRR